MCNAAQSALDSSALSCYNRIIAQSATDFLDLLAGRKDAGYDACHSACHSACVSSFQSVEPDALPVDILRTRIMAEVERYMGLVALAEVPNSPSGAAGAVG